MYFANSSAQTFIRDLGIERGDLVFSIQDPSPNVTLYFLNVKGYTALYQKNKSYYKQIYILKTKLLGINCQGAFSKCTSQPMQLKNSSSLLLES
jgi:hypothetical protein